MCPKFLSHYGFVDRTQIDAFGIGHDGLRAVCVGIMFFLNGLQNGIYIVNGKKVVVK